MRRQLDSQNVQIYIFIYVIYIFIYRLYCTDRNGLSSRVQSGQIWIGITLHRLIPLRVTSIGKVQVQSEFVLIERDCSELALRVLHNTWHDVLYAARHSNVQV